MKRLLLLCALAFAALSGSAQTYSYLTFETTDGTKTSLDVSDLTITYSATTATATNADGTTTFNLAELASMYFSASDETTGITAVENGKLKIEKIYSLDGRQFAPAADLPRGVYMLKTDPKKNAQKILVK